MPISLYAISRLHSIYHLFLKIHRQRYSIHIIFFHKAFYVLKGFFFLLEFFVCLFVFVVFLQIQWDCAIACMSACAYLVITIPQRRRPKPYCESENKD